MTMRLPAGLVDAGGVVVVGTGSMGNGMAEMRNGLG